MPNPTPTITEKKTTFRESVSKILVKWGMGTKQVAILEIVREHEALIALVEKGTREKNDWIWMPHAGHLIIGNRCLFHLSTFVNGYIVSTVGEYPGAFDRENGKFEEIGLSRLYETMVFKAQRDEKKACCPYTPSSWHELDFEGYNDAGAAREGHYALCEKYSKLSLNPKEGGTE